MAVSEMLNCRLCIGKVQPTLRIHKHTHTHTHTHPHTHTHTHTNSEQHTPQHTTTHTHTESLSLSPSLISFMTAAVLSSVRCGAGSFIMCQQAVQNSTQPRGLWSCCTLCTALLR